MPAKSSCRGVMPATLVGVNFGFSHGLPVWPERERDLAESYPPSDPRPRSVSWFFKIWLITSSIERNPWSTDVSTRAMRPSVLRWRSSAERSIARKRLSVSVVRASIWTWTAVVATVAAVAAAVTAEKAGALPVPVC